MAEGATTLKGLRAQMGKKNLDIRGFLSSQMCLIENLSLCDVCWQLPPLLTRVFERIITRRASPASNVSSLSSRLLTIDT